MRTSLLPPSERKLQLLFSSSWQLGDLLEELLAYTGPAFLVVATFSTGEEFLRRLYRLRKAGQIRQAVLYADVKAAEKTSRLLPMMQSCFEEVCLCRNHCKAMLVEGADAKLCVLTSQNQTRGNRLESYVVLNDSVAYGTAYNALLQTEVFKQWKSTSKNSTT